MTKRSWCSLTDDGVNDNEMVISSTNEYGCSGQRCITCVFSFCEYYIPYKYFDDSFTWNVESDKD